MIKIFYLILCVSCVLSFSSCSKGGMLQDPQFGMVSIGNFAKGNITIVQGTDHSFAAGGPEEGLPAGKNRFRFFDSGHLLLDTVLLVKPFVSNPFVMFRPDEQSAFKIYDQHLNGLDREATPDSGRVKLSLANFSASLPDKVNISITTTTYIADVAREVQIGEFKNVGRSFTGFQSLPLGQDIISSRPQTLLTMVVTDPADRKILLTSNITLPTTTNKALSSSTYLFFLDAANTFNLLMSK